MPIDLEAVKREASVREALDSGDLDLGTTDPRPEPFAEAMLGALESFGFKLSPSASKARKVYLSIRAEAHLARYEAAVVRERMALWDRDRLAWDTAATLAAGSFEAAELWSFEQHDLDGLEHRAKVLVEAERIADREFREAVYWDPNLDDKVAGVWASLAPPRDLLARDLPGYKRQAFATADVLRAFVMGHAKFEGVEPRTPDHRELSKRLKAALDGELGAGTFPTLRVLEAEARTRAEQLRAVEAATAEAESKARERNREDARAAARSRNPQREEVSA